MGLPTSGAALAVISRLTLYSARDQYNGNTMYSGVVNPDGTPLFPQTYNAQKWLTAADAAKAVIDLNTYSLYRDESDDPYLNYLGITHENWNSEIIFSGGGYHSRYTMGVHTAPSFSTGGSFAYGGWGPTQQQVDAYAMSNGRYPITGYEGDGSPIIDSESGYPASEFTKANFENPFMTALGAGNAYSSGSWPVMYRDREPRFYVSVFWGDSWWKYGDSYTLISFCQGANAHTSHDYPKPGYLVNRYYDHSLNSYNNNQWGNITFPTFRLGEINLNYIEAVLECERNGVAGESVDHNRAMELWAELRDRSGMAPPECRHRRTCGARPQGTPRGACLRRAEVLRHPHMADCRRCGRGADVRNEHRSGSFRHRHFGRILAAHSLRDQNFQAAGLPLPVPAERDRQEQHAHTELQMVAMTRHQSHTKTNIKI